MWAIAVSKLPYQTKVQTIPTNIQPVTIEIIVWFSGLGFLTWRCQNCWSDKGVILKVLCRVRETSSHTRGSTWASIEGNHTIKRLCLSPITRGNRFLSASMIRVELIVRIGRYVFVRTTNKRLVAARYRSAPDWLLIIVTAAICWHAGTRTGAISSGLMTLWYLLMSPRGPLPLWAWRY